MTPKISLPSQTDADFYTASELFASVMPIRSAANDASVKVEELYKARKITLQLYSDLQRKLDECWTIGQEITSACLEAEAAHIGLSTSPITE